MQKDPVLTCDRRLVSLSDSLKKFLTSEGRYVDSADLLVVFYPISKRLILNRT